MAKYSGTLGYVKEVETSPGVWNESIVDVPVKGDVFTDQTEISTGESVISDFKVSNRISIVASSEVRNNFQMIRYITYMNSKWSVSSIQVLKPRLIITLGGRWNGK